MSDLILPVLIALVGGGTLGAVVVKWLNRGVDNATAEKMKAEARQTAQSTAASEVQIIREVLQEVRDSDSRKTERIDKLEERLERLEERERHALTRAAVHEAWDRMSFALLRDIHPGHPEPPPLLPSEHVPHIDS